MKNFRFSKKALAVAMSFVLVGSLSNVFVKDLKVTKDVMYTEPFSLEENQEYKRVKDTTKKLVKTK